MASFSPKQLRLKVQTAKVKADKDPAFYIVPPLLVAAVFAFCAYVPKSVFDFIQRPSGVKLIAAAKVARVDMPDPNIGLPDYEIPNGCSNLLPGVGKASVSAELAEAPAANAMDGSCADDANVAVAMPSGDYAWWQAELPEGMQAQEVVIYGGGSQSPAGKFVGGFSVEVEYSNGETASREFCREGFALEGYESMKLQSEEGVKRIRVTALKPETPVVLREVQLIGYGE